MRKLTANPLTDEEVSPQGATVGTSSGSGRRATILVVAAGRDSATVAFETKVVAFFVDAAEILGVPRSVAAIYGICFANSEPLSFADIYARLDISQGSISQGLRVLREVGALKIAGTYERREYFAPELQLRNLAGRFVEERLEKQLRAGKEKLQSIKAALPSEETGGGQELKVRLKYLQSWHEKGRALAPLVKTFLKLS